MLPEEFVTQLQTYTTLLVSVKSRLWKNATRDADDEAQGLMVDYPGLLNIEPKRWQNWTSAKRDQAILKRLASLDNPYQRLNAAPLLFRTAQTRFRLSDDELRILLFMTITRTSYALASVFADCWETKQLLLFQDLSHLFGISLATVSRLLSRSSILRKSGLIFEPRYYNGIFEVMDGLVAATLEQPDQSIDVLLRHLYHRSRQSDFTIDDFHHVKHHLSAILKIFSQASAGANVLIYGPPGTGKTELAKAINMKLKTALYRLNPLTQEADDSRPMQRIDAFYQLQAVVKQQEEAAILFDEVEEIFASNDSNHTGPLKSFLNDLLETNTVPTLWVCNSIDNFDHAFIRRFDYVLHLDYPNYEAKRSYLTKQGLSPWLSRGILDRVAQHDSLSFGQLAQAIRLIKTLEQGAYRNNDRQFISMLNEYLRAVGHPLLTEAGAQMIERHHMPGLFNCSIPLKRVADVFNQCGFGRLLFQGESGTGKSTATEQIAEQCKLRMKTYTETELLALCELYGLIVVESVFSDLDPSTEVLVLEDFNQCLAPKPWQSGGLVDAVSTRIKTLLATFKGFVIVTVEGLSGHHPHLFDVSVAFKRLSPAQLTALEAYRNGATEALDRLGQGVSQTVVAFDGSEPSVQTETTLAEFHQSLKEEKIRQALTGQDAHRPKPPRERLSVVPKIPTP